jgi:tRNA dimethylallyltransferase
MGEISDEAPVWLIAGPTASGKSALALALAEATGGEIINADSMQVYRDLEILTARPSAADLARVPHHLYGVADGGETWSTGVWLRACLAVLADLRARATPAVIVGGTGLYFRALTVGLAEAPEVPAEAREAARRDYERLGERAFREALRALDPAAAIRIAPGDRQRLVRAMEVAIGTDRPLTDWNADTRPALAPGSWRGLILEPPRPALYARIDARVETMLAAGALEEVARLAARRLDPQLPLMMAVGAPPLLAHLAGELSLAEAMVKTQMDTRRYAKRQSTWFRNQTPDWPRHGGLIGEDAPAIASQLLGASNPA